MSYEIDMTFFKGLSGFWNYSFYTPVYYFTHIGHRTTA